MATSKFYPDNTVYVLTYTIHILYINGYIW